MPAYNAQRFIGESIESVLSQTYTNWELIIINDASNDCTKDICLGYSKLDCRIKLLNLELNGGITNARNIGINFAQGRFIAFLDSDDIWKSEKLETQLTFMQLNNIYFSFTGYDLIDSNSKPLNKTINVTNKVSFFELLKYNPIGCLTVVIDLKKIKKFQMPEIKHEDYATWLTLLNENNIEAYGVNRSLAFYRKTNNSVSSNKLKTLRWTYNIYRNHLGYNLFKSIIYLIRFILNTLKKYS